MFQVRILLDDSNVQHEKLVLKLVSPQIEGFSVEALPENAESGEAGESSSKKNGKRKSGGQEDSGTAKKSKK